MPDASLRPIVPSDAEAVARIHAESWRQAYRGSLSDSFLDGDLLSNRNRLWTKRLGAVQPAHFGFIADCQGEAIGFCFAFPDHDTRWGTQIDNLHVLPAFKGQGIGRSLLRALAIESSLRNADAGLYLWVYEKNAAAATFYEKLGGARADRAVISAPDGGEVSEWRYTWSSASALLRHLDAAQRGWRQASALNKAVNEEISKSRAIQMCYPDEPVWEDVEEDVLVQLVEDFEWEQSCATSAILELGLRSSSRFKALANWLLAHPAADQWLKAAATDALELRADDSAGQKVPLMSLYELAQLNVAFMKEPLDAPGMADFVNNLDRINELADASPGFVWRLQTADGDATAERPLGAETLVNMSVWRDVESLSKYVYKSAHVEIMRRRRDWFHRMQEAFTVLWWVPAGHRPGIDEALARLELLRTLGPSEQAFNFQHTFPAPDAA